LDRTGVPTISPTELKQELRGPTPPKVIDVRESDELEISRLPEAIHIPLNQLPYRLDELSPDDDLVILCRSGNRSGRATQFLLAQGFARVRNLATGINGWAREVDPTLPIY